MATSEREAGWIFVLYGKIRSKCFQIARRLVAMIKQNDAERWNSEGLARAHVGRYDEAIRLYEMALENDSNYARAWINKGGALFSLGKYDEAIKCFDRANDAAPGDIDAWVWNDQGNAFYGLGKYDEAIKYYNRAIERDQNYEYAWRNKGLALSNLGRYDEAVSHYDRAIQIDASYVDAWNDKGSALYMSAGYDEARRYEAIRCYERAIEIDPNYLWAWRNKGLALQSLRKYEEAIKCYDRAIEIDPVYMLTWVNKANALFDLGKYDEAERYYSKALNVDEKNVDALMRLGLIYSDYKYEYDRAVKLSGRLVEVRPDFYSKANYSEDLIKVGRYDEGRKYAFEALRDARDTGDEAIVRFLILCSRFLEGDAAGADEELGRFRDFYRNLNEDFRVGQGRWIFRGLGNAIRKGSMEVQRKFVVLTLIDVLQGSVEWRKLGFFEAS